MDACFNDNGFVNECSGYCVFLRRIIKKKKCIKLNVFITDCFCNCKFNMDNLWLSAFIFTNKLGRFYFNTSKLIYGRYWYWFTNRWYSNSCFHSFWADFCSTNSSNCIRFSCGEDENKSMGYFYNIVGFYSLHPSMPLDMGWWMVNEYGCSWFCRWSCCWS